MDLVLNNQQRLICHKTQPTNQQTNQPTNKLVQKETKGRHVWLWKAIYLELCKRFKFNQLEKWNNYKPEFVQENKKHKFSRILLYKWISVS